MTDYFINSDGFESPEDEYDELRAYEMAAEYEHILAGDIEEYLKDLWAHGVTSGDILRR